MFKKIAVAAALAIVASSSFAAPSFYVGGDVGSTKLDGLSDRQTSYGAYAGYEFMPNFAAEVGVRRLADFDVNFSNTNVGVTVDQYALSLIGTLPLSGGFNVFGRLGYNKLNATASANTSASESTSGGLYGVGVGYAFTPTISARAEIQKPSSDSTNVSVGVSFKF